MKRNEISRATMGRLPSYLSFIDSLPEDMQRISATSVASALGLGEVQVRKDLSAVCGSGKPKTGYEVAKLREAIESALGINRSCEAIIVGAGKLGSALLGYGGFAQYGITISHAFDTDSTKFSEYIRPLDELPSYCRMRQIEIGIITVPHDYAQETADFLIRSGVRAIWNFSSARLNVPDGITVQNESLALSLARLRQKVEKH